MPVSLPILLADQKPSGLLAQLNPIQQFLAGMNESQSAGFFSLDHFDRLLKTTISLCPICLVHVPAIVFAIEGRVLISKQCPKHGSSQAVIENDLAFYRLSNKDQWGRRFADDLVTDFPAYQGNCCGDGDCESDDAENDMAAGFTPQMGNKSCTVLVEVTNACNLACPVCYSDAHGDRKMPLDLFKEYMLRLIEKKGGLDSIQLTGGEALLHPEFHEMLAFLHGQSLVKRIYLPTNGIVLAKRDAALRLLPFKDKLMVLLQFDGQDVAANRALRAANTLSLRQRVVELLEELGIAMQLTMTLTQGVNDSQIGWVVDTAFAHSNIKLAALQPVTYSGRYDLPPDPLNRLTLSDVAKGVMQQAGKRMTPDEFVPIPCSHPNCGWITLFARRFGFIANISRHINMAQAMNEVSYKTVLSTGEIRQIVGGGESLLSGLAAKVGRKLIRAKDVVAVAIKPFMDRYNYDQDRISACCHHLLDTQGNPVSFCEYNAILRPGDSWERFPRVDVRDEAQIACT